MGRVYQLLARWFLLLFIVSPALGQSQNNILPIKGNFSGNFSGVHNGNGAGLSNIFNLTIQTTNPLIASGFTNGIYPGGTMQLATLNGLWFWNANLVCYTNSTNFYANFPSIAGSVFNVWGFTNKLFADTNTPNMFALGNTTPPGSINPQQTPGQMSDGTGAVAIGGQVQNTLITNFLVSSTLLQPSLSNQLHVFTPELYGAVGDNVTVDAGPLQLTINASFSAMTSGFPNVIKLSPQKTYFMSNITLTLPGPVQMTGDPDAHLAFGGGIFPGVNYTTLRWTNTSGYFYAISNANSEISGTLFKDIYFAGNAPPIGGVNGNLSGALYLANTGGSLIGQDIILDSCNFTGWRACICATNCDGLTAYNCISFHCTNFALINGGNSQACLFQACRNNDRGDIYVFDGASFGTLVCCDIFNVANGFLEQGSPPIWRNIVARGSSQVGVFGCNFEQGNPEIIADSAFVTVVGGQANHPAFQLAYGPRLTLTNAGSIEIDSSFASTLGSDSNKVIYLNANTITNAINQVATVPIARCSVPILVTNSLTGTTNYIGLGATNTLTVSSTGVTNLTSQGFLLTITAGTGLSIKDTRGNTFGTPVLGDTIPLRPGWGFTGTGITAQAYPLQ